MYKPEVVAPDIAFVQHINIRYTTYDSNSAAAPHVAGAVALLKELNSELTGTELKYLLLNTAHELKHPEMIIVMEEDYRPLGRIS